MQHCKVIESHETRLVRGNERNSRIKESGNLRIKESGNPRIKELFLAVTNHVPETVVIPFKSCAKLEYAQVVKVLWHACFHFARLIWIKLPTSTWLEKRIYVATERKCSFSRIITGNNPSYLSNSVKIQIAFSSFRMRKERRREKEEGDKEKGKRNVNTLFCE